MSLYPSRSYLRVCAEDPRVALRSGGGDRGAEEEDSQQDLGHVLNQSVQKQSELQVTNAVMAYRRIEIKAF